MISGDIENNQESVTITNTPPLSTTNVTYQPINANSSKNELSLCVKIFSSLCLIILVFPITFCDLYFGFSDDTCVSNHVDRININLKTYLIVSGVACGCFVFFLILVLCLMNQTNSATFGLCGLVLIYTVDIFMISWNIIGGVIFWGYMDNTTCSNNVYNYVFASLIIKYIGNFASLQNNKNSKKK
jgi:hypothetical protein